jgi:hypothetical protein
MSKHVHADLMLQYAQDAQETDKPWERWQLKEPEMIVNMTSTVDADGFLNCVRHPKWDKDTQYRRKPKTININGYEVPEPVRVIHGGHTYYSFTLSNVFGFRVTRLYHGSGEIVPYHLVDAGLVHATREAAEIHAKALLSFTKN